MTDNVECGCGDVFKSGGENAHYIETKGMCVNCLCGQGIEPFGPVTVEYKDGDQVKFTVNYEVSAREGLASK